MDEVRKIAVEIASRFALADVNCLLAEAKIIEAYLRGSTVVGGQRALSMMSIATAEQGVITASTAPPSDYNWTDRDKAKG
jgi:hypothetical protein